MSKIRKIKWIPLLMGTSQILLTGFVVYWLAGQYRGERKILHEEISRIFDDSRNQVMDSLLFDRVVEPALKDSVTITVGNDPIKDTAVDLLAGKPVRQAIDLSACDSGNAVVAISIPDSARAKMVSGKGMITMTGKKQDFLIRSVKLFITHSEAKADSTGKAEWFISEQPDTVLFMKVFTEKLNERYPGLKINWFADTSQPKMIAVKPLNGGNPNLHSSSVLPYRLPQATISGDFPLLFREILPQILFGLILLILTGSAFYLTNRNLRRQVMLNNLRNDFVSNITHELKTPVSTVRVAIEALKTYDKVKDPAVAREYLDMAGLEVDRLDRMIGKILDHSLIGDQSQLLQLQPVHLDHLIHEVIAGVQPRLDARGATVVTDIPSDARPVDADPLYLQGVLLNLFDNSLKYGPELVTIHITLYEQKGSVCLDIADNGPGIPKDYLGRVFDKFFRVPAGDTHNIKGYGLGLSFAALVMQQHGGSISVRNGNDGGCIFTLVFPSRTT
jgi:signal transduction histidine kinase